MSCTLEQIAEKRRIAKERLVLSRQKQQQQQPIVVSTPPTSVPSTHPPATSATFPKKPSSTSSHNNNANANSASQFMAVNSFYAKPSTPPPSGSPRRLDSGGKMKSSARPNARPQPYSPGGARSSSNGQHSGGAGVKTEQLAPVFLPTKTAQCSMLSADRFVVDVGFQSQMIDIFKTIPSRVYGKDHSITSYISSSNDADLLRRRHHQELVIPH